MEIQFLRYRIEQFEEVNIYNIILIRNLIF